MQRTGRVGIVPARYGQGVVGGAEALLADVAHGLAKRGWEVEVLTTCATDHFTWADVFPAGVSADGLVTVRRFPAVVDTPRAERAALYARIDAGDRLSMAEQERWVNDDVRVPELWHHLLDHAQDYRVLLFAPYLFWPTFACAQIAPERTILVPCLHDEPAAALELFDPLFSAPRGIWFLSDPERDVARRLRPRLASSEVVGAGVADPAPYDPEGFRRRHGIEGRFVLYAGRREGAKGFERLLDAFAAAVEHRRLPFLFVTMGAGEVHPPASIADRVIDLGYLPDEERHHAFAAADVYIQPSAFESFSFTIMEAWLAGTLVVANAASSVVRWHCERSGAGIVYDDDAELEECLSFVAEAPEAAAALAARGRPYVVEHYDPDAVLDRMEASIASWCPPDGEVP